MASAELDLGEVDLASTTSGLQLNISSHAHIASSRVDATERLTCAALNFFAKDAPWTTLGIRCQLTISLNTEDGLDDELRCVLLKAAAQSLHNAELWQQLRLRPASMECAPVRNHAIIIQLAHLDDIQEIPEHPLRKLAHGATYHDVEPPCGVDLIQLESVHLALHLTGVLGQKRRRLEHSASQCGMTPFNFEKQTPQHSQQGMGPDDEMLELTRPTVGGYDNFERLRLRTPSLSSTRGVKVATITACPEYDTQGMFSLKSFDPVQHRCPPTPSPGRKRGYSTGDLQSRSQPIISQQSFLDLLDAGVRSVIAPNPKNLGKGIRICGKESFKPLAEVFPQLWSPGYLAAASSRAVLLPTISSALSNVGMRHSKRSTLQGKIGELLRQQTSQNAGWSLSDDGSQPANPQPFIAAQLWRTMQRSLHDPDSANRLKTLAKTPTDTDNAYGEAYNILDVECNFPEPEELDHLVTTDEDVTLQHISPGLEGGDELYWSEAPTISEDEMAAEDISGVPRAMTLDENSSDDDLLSICESVISLSMAYNADNLRHSEDETGHKNAAHKQDPEIDEMLKI